MDMYARTAQILTESGVCRLQNSSVAVFGLGGVGSYAVEALARAGVGKLVLIDHDVIQASNINRQLYALHSTLNRKKVDVARERILDINPNVRVETHDEFFKPGMDAHLDRVDYVLDAVDTISAKLGIVCEAKKLGVRVISCMGAGNKKDAAAFEVADLYETSVCPLCRVMRRELKKREIDALRVVYSKEEPQKGWLSAVETVKNGSRNAVGSLSYVPAVAGLLAAGSIILELATD
ncbi:MAG: tRNA threonylcarbamoyladenosine dehydratase [Christensenellales bacterium]